MKIELKKDWINLSLTIIAEIIIVSLAIIFNNFPNAVGIALLGAWCLGGLLLYYVWFIYDINKEMK